MGIANCGCEYVVDHMAPPVDRDTGEILPVPRESSIETLLWQRAQAVYVAQTAAKDVREIEAEIKAKLEAEQIEDLDNPTWEVIRKRGKSIWNKARIMVELPELVSKEDYARVYTAAWDEPMPDKHHEADVNMTNVKPLAKKGKEVKALLAECETPGEWEMTIKRRKEENDGIRT